MKHYIYVDSEILKSYVSQIYGGIIEKETSENQYTYEKKEKNTTPEETIKDTVEGGLPFLKAKLELNSTTKPENIDENNESNVSKDVVEKIYYDNLLDNLIKFIDEKENAVKDLEKIKCGDYINVSIPFNFVSKDYLESIGNKKFKDAFSKINNSLGNNKNNEDKAAQKGIELIGNFATFFEACFPTNQLIINEKIIVPIEKEHLREEAKMINFKYGGNIKVIGKVTKNCGEELDNFLLLNKEFSKSIDDAKKVIYSLFLPNYSQSFIVTPIALYFE